VKELLRQTVTLYRRERGGISRILYEKAHLQVQASLVTDPMGSYPEKRFLLILPQDADVRPGDRVVAGEGPADIPWDRLGDACPVRRVELCHLEGKPHHVEAS